jgi:hypothetical protein
MESSLSHHIHSHPSLSHPTLSHHSSSITLTKPIQDLLEAIQFSEDPHIVSSSNEKAKQIEENERTKSDPEAKERYLFLKDHRLEHLEKSLKKKEENLTLLVEQQVKVKIEEVKMELTEKVEKSEKKTKGVASHGPATHTGNEMKFTDPVAKKEIQKVEPK